MAKFGIKHGKGEAAVMKTGAKRVLSARAMRAAIHGKCALAHKLFRKARRGKEGNSYRTMQAAEVIADRCGSSPNVEDDVRALLRGARQRRRR